MSNDLHVVVGAGPVGSAVAEILAEQGHRVRVVTRSGSGPESPQVERVRADAADAARLQRARRRIGRPLQLRQPALQPVEPGLAPGRPGPAGRR